MITPELKDKILASFIAVGPNCSLDIHEEPVQFSTTSDIYSIILDQMEKKGLIQAERMLGGAVWVSLTADAYDFHSHGGFVGQEVLLQKNIEKLLLEIEDLKPSMPEKVEKLAAIAGGISAALALFIR